MSQEKTFVRRITDELNDFWDAPFKIKVIVILIFCVVIFISYNEIFRIPSYKSKIVDLEKGNLTLETQLGPFKTIALDKFTGDENQRLHKLAIEVASLQRDMVALRDYGEVATWTFLGEKSLYGMTTSSPVSGWRKDYVVEGKDGELNMKCDSEAINYYKQMIAKHPLYPFPLYPLVLCLKRQGDDSWRQYAREAVRILEKTTLVPSHDRSHEDALQRFKKLLDE
jgi:hypothetical protein